MSTSTEHEYLRHDCGITFEPKVKSAQSATIVVLFVSHRVSFTTLIHSLCHLKSMKSSQMISYKQASQSNVVLMECWRRNKQYGVDAVSTVESWMMLSQQHSSRVHIGM